MWDEASDVPSLGSSWTSRRELGGVGGGNGYRDSQFLVGAFPRGTDMAAPLCSYPEPNSPPIRSVPTRHGPWWIPAPFCTIVTLDSGTLTLEDCEQNMQRGHTRRPSFPGPARADAAQSGTGLRATVLRLIRKSILYSLQVILRADVIEARPEGAPAGATPSRKR